MTQFPRTEVGGVSLPRMLAGTNWILGYSHTGPAADNMILARHSRPESWHWCSWASSEAAMCIPL